MNLRFKQTEHNICQSQDGLTTVFHNSGYLMIDIKDDSNYTNREGLKPCMFEIQYCPICGKKMRKSCNSLLLSIKR